MAAYTGVCFTTITVYTSPSSGVLSNIYSDVGMTVAKENPFPNFGNYTFYAAANQYVIQGDFTRLTGSTAGASYVPLALGTEPLEFVSDGAGQPILVPYTP